MFSRHLPVVTAEITHVLGALDDQHIEVLVREILNSRVTVVHGAGRVGLACKGFAMRLAHLGLKAYSVTDTGIPPVGKGDLVIVASSSGETQTVVDVAAMGKHHGAGLTVLTAAAGSRTAALADACILFEAPTKFGPTERAVSVQPMATLFEQCLQLFFDILVLMLMKETGQTHDDMWARHTNLD